MGRFEGSPVEGREPGLPGYERLPGAVPLLHAGNGSAQAREVRDHLSRGAGALSEILAVEPPELAALLVADEDWEAAPRENSRPYPRGLPYFTRATRPPALVLPERLSEVLVPRTEATYPLAAWHELAHAFLLDRGIARTPVWLRELAPQALAAAVARRAGLLEGHLARVDPAPGFTVREFGGRVGAEKQMAFQNLLLLLGAAALEEFGEGFLRRLVHALWEEREAVDEERAEALLAASLGEGGQEWLRSRSEF